MEVKLVVDVKPSVTDLVTVGGKVLALKFVDEYSNYTSDVIELDEEKREAHVVCRNIRGYGWGITATSSGCLVVATDEVLKLVTPDGHRKLIREGRYDHCRTAPDGDTVYAVRSSEKKGEPVQVDVISNGHVMRTVKTQVTTDCKALTCGAACHNKDLLYLCTEGDHCIHEVDMHTGQVVKNYGTYGATEPGPGELNCPRICMTDHEHDEIMVADVSNNRLQSFNVREKTWSCIEVKTPCDNQRLVEPTCAAVKDDQLFVGSSHYGKDRLWVLAKSDIV